MPPYILKEKFCVQQWTPYGLYDDNDDLAANWRYLMNFVFSLHEPTVEHVRAPK